MVGPRAATSTRVARLSYFFPAHNEEANLEGLVAEALETLPSLAEHVRDHRRRRRLARRARRRLADELAARHPDVVRVVHHPINLGYGAALRSGFAAARYELIAFTDGDRQFQVADLGRLTARSAEADAPDVVVGFRIKRADPFIRTALRARLPARQPDRSSACAVTDVDCACKLFRREALEGIRVESDGAFFSAELLIKLREAGRTVVEVGVPHYPRTAGSATGAKPTVILRAVRDFWRLRLYLWVNRGRAAAPRRADPRRRLPGSTSSSRRPSPSGSTSSELTKSRKTSSRGSTMLSPVASSVDPASPSLVVQAAVGPEAGLLEHRVGGEDPDARRTARASASDGRASTSTVRPSRSSDDAGRGTSRRPAR